MEVDPTPPSQKAGDKPLVNGECKSPGEVSTSPAAVGFRHHLPQMASVTRTKIAQSKASAKRDNAGHAAEVEATLHIEGTGKVVKMDADLKTELCVQEAGDVSPGTTTVPVYNDH